MLNRVKVKVISLYHLPTFWQILKLFQKNFPKEGNNDLENRKITEKKSKKPKLGPWGRVQSTKPTVDKTLARTRRKTQVMRRLKN